MDPQQQQTLDSLRAQGKISEEEYAVLTAKQSQPVGPPAVTGFAQPTIPGYAVVAAPPPPLAHCCEGHPMTITDVAVTMTSGKHGVRVNRTKTPICTSCFVKIPEEDGGFFACQECLVNDLSIWRFVCKSCALSGHHLRYPKNNPRKVGLCSCGPYCMDSWLCFYCLLGHLACDQGDGLPADGSDPSFSCKGFWCGVGIASTDVLLYFTCLYGWIFTNQLQTQLTRKFNLEEQTCTDCLTSCFCRPCALAQVGNEHVAQGVYLGGVCCTKRPSSCPPRPPRPSAPMLPQAQQAAPAVAWGSPAAMLSPYPVVQQGAPGYPAPQAGYAQPPQAGYAQPPPQGYPQQAGYAQPPPTYGSSGTPDPSAPPPIQFAGANDFELQPKS